MIVEIKGIHGFAPSPSAKIYIDKKLKRLDHFREHVANLHLTIAKEGSGEYDVEAGLHFRWGTMGHMKVVDRDLFKAIDFLFDKIEHKATKEKEKIQQH